MKGAEKLGLDLASFAVLMDDYLLDLDARIKEITQAITQNNSFLALEILSQLQDATHSLHIPELIKQFIYLEQTLRKSENEEEYLHALLLCDNAIKNFKHSLQ